ncbi:MAG TPA: transcriptional regulator [Spirochaetia bacterium]|nr:transcriptional regulator [Spirochaetia bacterium]
MIYQENRDLEYKRELTDNLEKEAVAFLNSREGGRIIIGVDTKTQAVPGVDNPDNIQLQVKDRLKNNIEPSVMGLFDVIVETCENKPVIKIILAAGSEKPYYLKKYGMTSKGCFIRVGSASEPMQQNMIESFFSTRVRNSIGKMISPRQSLTFEQLKIYYLERGLKLNDAFMNNLELLTPDGKPNYAAYLLSDDNGISIQIAKYADTTRVHLTENRDYGRCSLIKACKQVLERIEVENTVFTQIGYPLRKERELINSVAVREAVINAIVHNEYSNGSCPKFEFFSDRIEITSAGGLPYGLSKDDFFAGHSAPRNKELMRVFRDLEIVEQLGSGIPRILDAYGEECFQISQNFIRLVFIYANEGVTEGVTIVMNYIMTHPGCRVPVIAEAVNIPAKSVERYIRVLKEQGKIIYSGAPKSGGYRMIMNNE